MACRMVLVRATIEQRQNGRGRHPHHGSVRLPARFGQLEHMRRIITVYGPTNIKEITNLISDGLMTGIDLEAVSSIASFLVILYVFGSFKMKERKVWRITRW